MKDDRDANFIEKNAAWNGQSLADDGFAGGLGRQQ
jgi:hypothetical protein